MTGDCAGCRHEFPTFTCDHDCGHPGAADVPPDSPKQRVEFALDGIRYEVFLPSGQLDEFRAAVARFVAAAHTVTERLF
jgi:hypothetical protein